MSTSVTRRPPLLAAAGLRALTASANLFETPYKYGQLVLKTSNGPASFDSRSVGRPFVCHHGRSFYMTCLVFDGLGDQTGLAASGNLITRRRLGCILRRHPSSPVIRYNAALNGILRENALHSPGRALKVNGRFLGVFHAHPGSDYEQGPAVIGLCTSRDLLLGEIGGIILRPEDGANGPPGSPGERFSSDPYPCVLLYRDTWAAFYYGLDAHGKARDLLALGETPEHFEKVQAIMVDVGPPGSVDEDYAHKSGVAFHHGSLYHFYCAVSGRWPREVRGISVVRSRPRNSSRSADQTLG